MHEQLRIAYNTFVTKCLDDKERQENDITIDVKRLILPGEEDEALMFETSLPSAAINGKEEERKQEESKSSASVAPKQPPGGVAPVGDNES